MCAWRCLALCGILFLTPGSTPRGGGARIVSTILAFGAASVLAVLLVGVAGDYTCPALFYPYQDATGEADVVHDVG